MNRFIVGALVVVVVFAGAVLWPKYNSRIFLQDGTPQTGIVDSTASTTITHTASSTAGCIEWDSNSTTADPNKVVTSAGSIYYCGVYRGKVEGHLLTILLSTSTEVSFAGDVDLLRFDYSHEKLPEFNGLLPRISYDSLVIAEIPEVWASRLTKPQPDRCGSPSIKDAVWFKCSAVGSLVSMYELTDYVPVTYNLGGYKSYHWRKVYSIKDGPNPVMAFAPVSTQEEYSIDDTTSASLCENNTRLGLENSSEETIACEQAQHKVARARTEQHLEGLLHTPSESAALIRWDKLVSHLTIQNRKN